jgi:hypothetical protein
MKLITAKVTSQPRTVNTKHGERSVIDCVAQNGETLTIWRPAHDQQLMRLANGERVQIAIDSKGKVSLVEKKVTTPCKIQKQYANDLIKVRAMLEDVNQHLQLVD